MGLADLIIEKRLGYIKNIKERLLSFIFPNPIQILNRFMFVPEDVKEENIVKKFIEEAKKKDYFKNLYEKIKGEEFTFETLKRNLKDVVGESVIEHDRLLTPFLQVGNIVDNYFSSLIEPLKSLPLAYSSGEYPEGFGIEPNCIGACQIISVLYSYDHNLSDLEFLEVYSTKRRDTLLQKLKELEEKQESSSLHTIPYFEDFVEARFDIFEGIFPENNLKYMLLDTILSLEDFTHGSIRNKRTGEIYDYEIERENYKGVISRDIEDGIFYSTLSNLLIMLNDLGYNKEELKKVFNNYYSKFNDSVLMNSVGLLLYDEYEKRMEFLEKIKSIYGEDIPAKYIIAEIYQKLPYFCFSNKGKKELKEKIEYLKETYILPDALEIISLRYTGKRDYLQRVYEHTK